MSEKTTLILGGGIGGLTTATHLRRLAPAELRIVLAERRRRFLACTSQPPLMDGEGRPPAEVAPPVTGQGMQSEAGAPPWTAVALAASGVALVGLGAATLRRARGLG